MVNITAFNFNSICLVIIAKSKTSSSHNIAIIPYEVDRGSNGNIIPCNKFKILFPRASEEQSAAAKNRSIVLKTYKTTIQQLGSCSVRINHENNKKTVQILCSSRKWSGIVRHARCINA